MWKIIYWAFTELQCWSLDPSSAASAAPTLLPDSWLLNTSFTASMLLHWAVLMAGSQSQRVSSSPWFKITLPVSCLMCMLWELLSVLPEELFVVLSSQKVNIPFIFFQSTRSKMQIRVEQKLLKYLSLYMHRLSAVSTGQSDNRESCYCQSNRS